MIHRSLRNFFVGVLILGGLSGCARNHDTNLVATPTPFHRPLDSPGAKFAALPPVIQKTIRAEIGTAQISDIVKVSVTGNDIYTVYLERQQELPPLRIAQDGSVLNLDNSIAIGASGAPGGILVGNAPAQIGVSELPANVRTALASRASSTAHINSITRQTWGDRDVYTITFADPQSATLYIAADGTVLYQGSK